MDWLLPVWCWFAIFHFDVKFFCEKKKKQKKFCSATTGQDWPPNSSQVKVNIQQDEQLHAIGSYCHQHACVATSSLGSLDQPHLLGVQLFGSNFYQNRAKIQELRIIYLSANCETVFVPTLIVLSLSSLVLQGYQPSFKILKQCQLSRGEILFGYGCGNYEHKTVD